MSRESAAVVPDVAALVAGEVERQLRALRGELDARLAALAARTVDDRATLVVFSNDLDRVLAAFVIATGAAAAGLETSMFFTFWGLTVLRRPGGRRPGKPPLERLLGALLPAGSERLRTSRLDYFGAGARLLRRRLKSQKIASLEELIALGRELGVRLIACTMSMEALGISRDELVDGLDFGGVATYMADAARSRVTLFV
jgi:peroxiredoxin family protein